MRKMLSSPGKMPLNEAEKASYTNALKFVTDLSLNLMAVKVENRPEDYIGWCSEFIDICHNRINMDLLDDEQIPSLKKLVDALTLGASISQLKMARITPWPIFVDFIRQQDTRHALDERMLLLSYIEQIKETALVDMTELDRYSFTGKHTQQHCDTLFNFDVELFSSTKSAKIFHTLLAQSPEAFDAALSNIPEQGDVTPQQYKRFVRAYKDIFENYTVLKSAGEKAPLVPATRLLTMKRPDQFIALTNNKIQPLCQGLSIAKFNAFDFDSYWQDMIGTIRTFSWWHQPKPADKGELNIWNARVALMDLFLFVDEDFALNSNYLRNKDKRLNKPVKVNRLSKAKIKLSAEELVDQALSAEGISENIKAQRETIIKQVKAGKSVEHTIGLIRSIFS